MLTSSTSSRAAGDEAPSGVGGGSRPTSNDPEEFALAEGIDAIGALECLIERFEPAKPLEDSTSGRPASTIGAA